MSDLIKNKQTGKSRIAACFVVILLLVGLALTLSSCNFFSNGITLKNLEIVVDIHADGTTVFSETSEAKFSRQDTDWWNFYRIIDDDSLIERMSEDKTAFAIDKNSFCVDGVQVPFEGAIDLEGSSAKKIYTAKYAHQTVGYFYARSSGVEIGVIMPEFSSGTHTISYRYSVKGLVKGIADASVFYYKYLSEINTMDVDKMSVTVNFPTAEPELRSWLHTSASAVGVWKQSEDKKSVQILVEDVSAGEYIESRMLLDKWHYTILETDSRVASVDVENEEQKWYEAYRREQSIRLAVTILDYVLAVLAIGYGVLWYFLLKRRFRPISASDAPIYYRDIPEGYTGGEVSPLYFYYSSENYIDESISATMLELVRLGYITITPDEKRKSAVVTVLKQDEEEELRTHQKFVIEMLLAVKPLGMPFTMKEFERYGNDHPGKMMRMVDLYKAAILNKSQREGAYRRGLTPTTKAQRFSAGMVGVGIAIIAISGFTSFILSAGMFFTGVGFLIGGLIPYLMLKLDKHPPKLQLSPVGQKEYDMLHALGKYMQEFSLMKDHELPALVLWEDYMIFATAMGIADKVAEQLEIAYPEFRQISSSGFDPDRFMILWFFSRSFRGMTGLNFVGNVANVVRSVQIAQRALKAAEMAKKIGGSIGGGSGRGGGSSFHGGGGGFSGGGFGGRR